MNKRGFGLYQDWAELLFFVLLFVGLILALTAGSAVLNYIIIFLCGMMGGRVMHQRKKKFGKVPAFLIILGFLLGYMIGSYYGSTFLIVVFFMLGGTVSYELHERRYLR